MKILLKAKTWLTDRKEGASAVEYAILIGLIAVVVIAAVTLLGPAIAGVFNNVTSELPTPAA